MKKDNKAQKNIFSNHGQTLIELIVAVGVLIVGVLSVLTLTTSSTVSVGVSTGHLIASNLAREGIEVVRAIRDSNWLEKDAWDDGLLDEGDPSTAVPIIDYNSGSTFGTSSLDFGPDDIDTDGQIYITINGEYNHNNQGTPTNFYRLITIDSVGDRLEIEAHVKWIERNREHEIKVEDWLYDWQ